MCYIYYMYIHTNNTKMCIFMFYMFYIPTYIHINVSFKVFIFPGIILFP